ncbi:LOW QUALITY PROTEIN: hypothetical protein HZS_2619, partial [Henneguya salminicola]
NISKHLVDTLCRLYNSLNSAHIKINYYHTSFQTHILREPPRSLFTLYGSGANEKSAFVRHIMLVYEHLAVELSSDIFRVSANRYSNSPSQSLLPLCKARIAFSLEHTKQKLSSFMVKKLCSGGDTIVGRNLYSSPIVNLRMTPKIFINVRICPIIDCVDAVILNRVRIIPFLTIFETILENK